MPLVESHYSTPGWYSNPHVQTIFPNIFRRIRGLRYDRERIPTPDNDFLDLDWSRTGSKKLLIISHGLEGSSDRRYVQGLASAFNNEGWDTLAWNFRGCSGEMNRLLKFYHSGKSEDLDTVIRHVLSLRQYSQIALAGFSVGGNITLKYLGERDSLPSELSGAIAFSVPCELGSSSVELARPRNSLYMKRFLRTLHEKIRSKMKIFPGEIDDMDFSSIKNFKDFDDRYTAPLNGYRDADEYWRKNSSRQFIPNITIPALLVSAANDPFLSRDCFPVLEAETNKNFFLEIPAGGGHVGFAAFGDKLYWSEKRALEFLSEVSG